MEYYINAKYFRMKLTDRMIGMITSRGCVNKCNFCQRIEKGLRLKPIESVIDTIKKYIKDYNITYIFFYDELFWASERRLSEFSEAILKENINVKYCCAGHLTMVTKKTVKMLKRSGCDYIDYGIEQFDNHALKGMNKNLTEDQIIRGIGLTQKENIGICFNIIFGNVEDTKQSLRKSMALLKKYNDYGQLRVIRPVTPYPGTPLYDMGIKKGLLSGPEDFYEKHKNMELLTCNFTNISDSEFYKLLYEANKEVINDYYKHIKSQTIETFRKVYFGKDYSFRGSRHK